MASGKEAHKYKVVTFNLKKELNDRVGKLCAHRGDKAYYLNLAVEYWLGQQAERVSRFNERIKG